MQGLVLLDLAVPEEAIAANLAPALPLKRAILRPTLCC